jgi:hypothetical protein
VSQCAALTRCALKRWLIFRPWGTCSMLTESPSITPAAGIAKHASAGGDEGQGTETQGSGFLLSPDRESAGQPVKQVQPSPPLSRDEHGRCLPPRGVGPLSLLPWESSLAVPSVHRPRPPLGRRPILDWAASGSLAPSLPSPCFRPAEVRAWVELRQVEIRRALGSRKGARGDYFSRNGSRYPDGGRVSARGSPTLL